MAMLIFAVLLLLLNAVHYSSCERFNIVPSPDSPCPGEFTGEPCLTLEQYVANPSLSSDITFELHPGNHHLNSELQVLNINSITMRANTSATVTCNQQLNRPLHARQLQQVHVSGITFVGCRMELRDIINATFERNSFMDWTRCCPDGAALHVQYSSVIIRLCNISNNRGYDDGVIYGYQSTFLIEEITFSGNNPCCSTSHGGAIYTYYGNIVIHNSNFSSNSAGSRSSHGGAIYIFGGVVNIIGINFSGNRAGSSGHGGAIYVLGITTVTIIDCNFNGNRAGSHGGAVYFDSDNITVTNSSFINNIAIAGGGGAIYSVRRFTNISLINNIFSHNTAAYCGVIAVMEFYHYHVNITGNTFSYNRAIQRISGNNGGGVICIRNASMLVMDNIFSHNSAAGDAGVIQVDESDIIIEWSIFSNNTAGGNGGVLHTYFYPTRYTIIDSFFTNNRAGGDGGVMYVGRAGSHVTVNQSTFGFNNATNRGGIIAIIGSTLEIDRSNMFENTAELGEVISACNSDVTITNPELVGSQDPVYSFCTLYDSSNTTISRTTVIEQTTPTTDTTTMASTTTEHDALITTTLPPTDDVTATEEVTTTVETTPQTEEVTTTEGITDVITTVSTTEDINIVTATATEPLQGITTTASTTVMEETTSTVAPTEELTTISENTIDATTTVSTTETSTPEPLQGTTTSASTTTTEDSETTTIENVKTATTSPSQEITTTEEDIITSTTHEEAHTTKESISTTAPSQTFPPETSTNVKSTESFDAVPMTTRPVINPVDDGDKDTVDYNLHTIIPGYVAIGACAVLIIIVFIGFFVIVKMFQRKPKAQNVNLSAYEYPKVNEYSLPDVHVAHT